MQLSDLTTPRSPREIRRRLEGVLNSSGRLGANLTGNVATVIGGGGNFGTAVVAQLVDSGVQCIVPKRAAVDRRHLLAFPNQMAVTSEWDPRVESEYERVIRPSNYVIYCAGKMLPSSAAFRWYDQKYGYSAVHTNIPRMVARKCKELDVERFIYVSALNASADNDSEVLRRKYATEIAIREEFPEATIVRPSIMFGPRDMYTHYPLLRSHWMHYTATGFPVPEGAQALHAPVHMGDVARAISLALRMEHTVGQTIELTGPVVHQWLDVLKWIYEIAMQEFVPVPMTREEFLRYARAAGTWVRGGTDRTYESGEEWAKWVLQDWVANPKSTALTFADLGLAPEDLTIMENVAYQWLSRFKNWDVTPFFETY